MNFMAGSLSKQIELFLESESSNIEWRHLNSEDANLHHCSCNESNYYFFSSYFQKKFQYRMTAFEEFGVMPEIGRAVDEMDWTLPTDVQVTVRVDRIQGHI